MERVEIAGLKAQLSNARSGAPSPPSAVRPRLGRLGHELDRSVAGGAAAALNVQVDSSVLSESRSTSQAPCLVRESFEDLTLATHDQKLAVAGRAVGFRVQGS